MIITFSECVSVHIVTQQTMRMRRVILSSVARLPLSNFSAMPHRRHDFRGKKVTEHKMCVFSLQLLPEKKFIPRRIQRYTGAWVFT